MCVCVFFFFFFNDTATTEIYTLSLHDALPISVIDVGINRIPKEDGKTRLVGDVCFTEAVEVAGADRKSTRLNSSHVKRSRMPSSA